MVLYDHLADRWIITQFTVSPPYNECIAVSTSGDPTGAYYRYAFELGTDTIGSRLMFRAAYRNYGDHQSLFASHTVNAASGFQAGVRWYELRDPAGATPTLTQNSTYAPDSANRWMGSIDADRAGNLALGYSASSTTLV